MTNDIGNAHEMWLRKLAAELQSDKPPTTSCIVHTVLQAANEISQLQRTLTRALGLQANPLAPELGVELSPSEAADEIERLTGGRAQDQQRLFHYEGAIADQRAEIQRLRAIISMAPLDIAALASAPEPTAPHSCQICGFVHSGLTSPEKSTGKPGSFIEQMLSEQRAIAEVASPGAATNEDSVIRTAESSGSRGCAHEWEPKNGLLRCSKCGIER